MTAAAPLVVWRLLDGKAGHEKQSAALLQALAALRRLETHDLDVRGKWLVGRQGRRQASSGSAAAPALPPPALIVGAGHRTHLPMLMARRAHGGKCVALMKPTLPTTLFDLIFVPAHDRTPRRPNLIETEGVICSSVVGPKDDHSGLILLGGHSRHFAWSNDEVAGAVAAIGRLAPEVSWLVCDSRRTPGGFAETVPRIDNLEYLSWRDAPCGFLERALATARYAWVTVDSASMLYEALSAAAQVGVIDLPVKRPRRANKHARGVAKLRDAGRVHSSRDGFRLTSAGAARAAVVEPENRRCARILAERLLGGVADGPSQPP